MTKALAMISGGLDSILAAKLIKEQGIDVIGICFKSYFFSEENAVKATEQIDIPLKVVDISKEHLSIVKNPKHGHGKNMNPCIDCHSYMLKKTGELLKENNADFIVTGEVLNQRPMSQRKAAMNVVKKESGYAEKILRPLSAKVLPPTEMEEKGLVDREKLLGISGRSRKIQMELAKKWDIKEYPSPAGGCKLTEPNYSNRLRELLQHKENVTDNELEILRLGRHFRITDDSKIISTRTAEEYENIKPFLSKEDLIFIAKDFKGSVTILMGEASSAAIEYAAKVTGRYSKGKDEEVVHIKYGNYGCPLNNTISVKPANDNDINEYIIH